MTRLAIVTLFGIWSLLAVTVSANHLQTTGHPTATGNYLSSADAVAQELTRNTGSSARGREIKATAGFPYGTELNKSIGNWNTKMEPRFSLGTTSLATQTSTCPTPRMDAPTSWA